MEVYFWRARLRDSPGILVLSPQLCSRMWVRLTIGPWRVPLPISQSGWSNISRMRRSVSSPDETPRRELKIWCAAEYFWRTSRCFIWWWNTVSNAWYYFSNKMILEGEIKDAKMSSFSSDFQTLIKLQFPLYFLYELLMHLRRKIRIVFPVIHWVPRGNRTSISALLRRRY